MAGRTSARGRRQWSTLGSSVLGLWEATLNDEGADSDFTSAIKPIERAAGITVGNSEE
jgi:3-hydroxyisobutyrate dehydrogenase